MKIIQFRTEYGWRYLNCDYVQSFKEVTEKLEIIAVNEIGNETVIYVAKNSDDLRETMRYLTTWFSDSNSATFML